MEKQERILVLEAIEVLQNGRALVVKAVVASPLQKTDLYRDLRQLESVSVNSIALSWWTLTVGSNQEAELGSKSNDFFF